jgi:aspartyl-tRNA(Asn)/glutamyl-tRNA(Gln) amidotransferase subunit A
VAAVQRALQAFPRRAWAEFPDPLAFDNTPLYYGEAAAVHRDLFPSRAEEYGADVAEKLAKGNQILARDYLVCRQQLGIYRTQCELAFARFDVLAAPTLPCVAPALGATYVELPGGVWPVGRALTRNTRPFNNLGWPVVALPCGEAEDGLPASLSLIGRPGDDQRLLAIAEACEGFMARNLAP